MPKITDFALKNIAAPSRGQIVLTDDISPLRVRISQGGAKTFVVNLGRGRRHTIGRYGEVSLADAREAARRMRAHRTLGRILPTAKNFDDARKEYLAQVDVRPSTKEYYVRHLHRLAASKVGDLTPEDINRVLDALPRGARDQCLASFRPFFKWCIRRHYLERSPCELMQLGAQRKRARVLSDQELQCIWRACEQRVGAGNLRHREMAAETPIGQAADQTDGSNALPAHFATIVKLLLLTGQRRGEIAALQTSWISSLTCSQTSPSSTSILSVSSGSPPDLCTITLPASVTKNGREHTFPISQLCTSLISPLLKDPQAGTALLLPARGHSSRPFNGWSKSKVALDKLCGVTGWTLHDLRRTFRTNLAKLSVAPHIAERLINHVSSRDPLEDTYDLYKYLPEMCAAMEKWEAHLQTILQSV